MPYLLHIEHKILGRAPVLILKKALNIADESRLGETTSPKD